MEQGKEIGRHLGNVEWFNRNYGFIRPANEGDRDIFVYYEHILCEGFKTLKKGQRVEYSIGSNKRGQPIAIDVVVIK
jgi:CspA family cold shock protein